MDLVQKWTVYLIPKTTNKCFLKFGQQCGVQELSVKCIQQRNSDCASINQEDEEVPCYEEDSQQACLERQLEDRRHILNILDFGQEAVTVLEKQGITSV